MKRGQIIGLMLTIVLSSCSLLEPERIVKEESSINDRAQWNVSGGDFFDPTSSGRPDDPLAPLAEAPKMVSAKTQEEIMSYQHKGEVFYTDAHNPYAHVKDLDDIILPGLKSQTMWNNSYQTALKQARYENKPVLVWFHDSRMSPPSRKLKEELFDTEEFQKWAQKNVVRLLFDVGETFEGPDYQDVKVRRDVLRRYVQKAHKNFNVRGIPVIMLISPDGSIVNSVKGYSSGKNRYYFDVIKHNTNLAHIKYTEYKKKLTQSGFRTWSGSNGKSFFAKVIKFDDSDPAKRTLWLALHDGQIVKVFYDSMIPADREFFDKHKDTILKKTGDKR